MEALNQESRRAKRRRDRGTKAKPGARKNSKKKWNASSRCFQKQDEEEERRNQQAGRARKKDEGSNHKTSKRNGRRKVKATLAHRLAIAVCPALRRRDDGKELPPATLLSIRKGKGRDSSVRWIGVVQMFRNENVRVNMQKRRWQGVSPKVATAG